MPEAVVNAEPGPQSLELARADDAGARTTEAISTELCGWYNSADKAVYTVCELIRRHSVRYEVIPYYVIFNHKRILSGFDLELYGKNVQEPCRWSPGDADTLATYSDLHEIAEWIVPEVDDPVKCEILPYDNAVHACARSHMQPEVRLCVRVSHPGGLEDPANREQEEFVRKCRLRLSYIGLY